jgi:hypothetical protein
MDLETLFPPLLTDATNSTSPWGSEQNEVNTDDVVVMLQEVVADARATGTLNGNDQYDIPRLVRGLYNNIFELEPRDVAEIITLPFFVAKVKDEDGRLTPGGGKGGDSVVEAAKADDDDDDDEDDDDMAVLMGVPVMVLVTRTLVPELFPDLLPSDVLPQFPLLGRLFFSNEDDEKDATVFADDTMTAVQTILMEANITGAEGMFADDPINGTAVVDLLMNRTVATWTEFQNDPVSTAVRVVVASAMTGQSILRQVAPLLFGSDNGNDVSASNVLTLLNATTTTTDPAVVGSNIRVTVQDTYPSVVIYGDYFMTVTKNIVDTAVPGYLSGGPADPNRPVQSLLGGFFDVTNSCEVELTSCEATLMLAEGLTRDLNDKDDDLNDKDDEVVVVAPAMPVAEKPPKKDDKKDDTAEAEEEEPAKETFSATPVDSIQVESSTTLYFDRAVLLIVTATATGILTVAF